MDNKTEILRKRSEIVGLIRRFFDDRGFIEVETTVMVDSPGLEVHLSAFEVDCGAGKRYLITSPEYQMKMLLADGMDRIYQITRVFRRDERGIHHNEEFTMLEWYRAGADYTDIMNDLEEMTCFISWELHKKRSLSFQGNEIDLSPPWERVTFFEALAKFGGVENPERMSRDEQLFVLVDRVEKNLGFRKPVFLCDYPASMASLARRKPSNPDVAERFELYICGIEIANAFSELTDAREQTARFGEDLAERERLGLPLYPVDRRFVESLKKGLPESAGVALGADRLVMILLDKESIDAVRFI